MRGGKLDEKTLMTNSFILGNKFNDVWFQELNLVALFEKEIQYFYKYFEGPRVLPSLDFMLSSQSHENDLHLVSYISDLTAPCQLLKLKQFRKMSQTNQNEVWHYQYWLVTDPELAAKMGINTENVGDVNLLRPHSAFTHGKEANVNLNGYPFVSEVVASNEEVTSDPEGVQARVLNYAFNSPVLIKDYR